MEICFVLRINVLPNESEGSGRLLEFRREAELLLKDSHSSVNGPNGTYTLSRILIVEANPAVAVAHVKPAGCAGVICFRWVL